MEATIAFNWSFFPCTQVPPQSEPPLRPLIPEVDAPEVG